MKNPEFTINRNGQTIYLTQDELESAYQVQKHAYRTKEAKEKTLQLISDNANLIKCPWALPITAIENEEMDNIFNAMAESFEKEQTLANQGRENKSKEDIWEKILEKHIGPIIARNVAKRIIANGQDIIDEPSSWTNLCNLVENYGIRITSNLLLKTKTSGFDTVFDMKDILEQIYFNDLLGYYVENLC